MSYESDDLRVAYLNDEKGKTIKGESLFLNLYDYCTLVHAEYKFEWYHPKIAILEIQLRKKLKDFKDFPLANAFLEKFEEKDNEFCSVNYLNDEENYLEKRKRWKKIFRKIPAFRVGLLTY